MPERLDLKNLEIYCRTVNDWTDLALQSLEEPADENYAVELAGKAIKNCQNLEDCVNLAQFVACHLQTDSDYLEDFLEQAEAICFEPMDYAELGNACTILGSKERGLAFIYKAVEDVDPDEKGDIVRLSDYAYEAGSRELAELLEMEASFGCLDASAILVLASSINSSDIEAAKAFAKRAKNHLNTISDKVSFATEIFQSFGDQNMALQQLESVAIDCSDFEDYVELGQGLSAVLGTPEQINNFLDEAEENRNHANLLEFFKAVHDFASDRAAWISNLLSSLHSWIRIETKYDIRYSHKVANSACELLHLAERAVVELKNPSYSRELIDEALARMEEQNSDISSWLKATEIAAYDLHDADLTRKITEKALSFNRQLTSRYMTVVGKIEPERTEKLEQILGDRNTQISYPSVPIRLIEIVLEVIGDSEWAERIIDSLIWSDLGNLQLAELGDLYRRVGNASKSLALYQSAITRCISASSLSYLMNCLQTSGIDESQRKSIYRESHIKESGGLDKLRWIEGILLHFDDREWAEAEYNSFESWEISNDALRSLFNASRQQFLDKRF